MSPSGAPGPRTTSDDRPTWPSSEPSTVSSPASLTASSTAPSTAAVGRLLASSAVRFHPSPYVEERLAERLARAAAGPEAGPAEPRLLAFPGVTLPLEAHGPNRNLIVGGAIASGVSLAGAAYLAWRRRRVAG